MTRSHRSGRNARDHRRADRPHDRGRGRRRDQRPGGDRLAAGARRCLESACWARSAHARRMSRRRAPLACAAAARRRRRRRRPIQLIATVVLLLAPLAVAAAVYLAFASDDAGGGAAGLPIAVHTPPGAARVRRRAPEPAPGRSTLTGVDAFHLQLHKPPRAGLVFDVDERRRAVAARPAARAADREPDEDHDRAARGRAHAAERPGADHAGGARLHRARASGCCRRAGACALEALLNGLLIVSGNDAAIALAVHVSGSERALRRADEPRRAQVGADAARTSRRRTGSRRATARARATWRC